MIVASRTLLRAPTMSFSTHFKLEYMPSRGGLRAGGLRARAALWQDSSAEFICRRIDRAFSLLSFSLFFFAILNSLFRRSSLLSTLFASDNFINVLIDQKRKVYLEIPSLFHARWITSPRISLLLSLCEDSVSCYTLRDIFGYRNYLLPPFHFCS